MKVHNPYIPSFQTGADTVFGRKLIDELGIKPFRARNPTRDSEEARAVAKAFERDMKAALKRYAEANG